MTELTELHLNEPQNAYLLVVRCPAGHAIYASVLESPPADLEKDTGPGGCAQRLAREMRWQVVLQIERKELSAQCPDCGSPLATWRVHFHPTNYATAEEVETAAQQQTLRAATPLKVDPDPQNAVEQLARALEAEGAPAKLAFDYAEFYGAILSYYNVPIEKALEWIHLQAPAQEWTGDEFRNFCKAFARKRDQARREDLEARP